MSNIIDSIKVSGVTYEIQGSGGITIDPTLDSGSTNAVANSAITTALDAKVNVADNEVSGLTIKNIPYYGVAYPYGKVEKLYFTSKISDNVNNAVFYPYAITSDGTTNWYTITYSIQNGVITSVTSSHPSSVAASLEDGVACLTFIDRTFHHFWQDYSNRFDFWFYSDYTGGQSADVIEGSVADAISDTYNDAMGLASTMVDKNDNHASGLTVGFNIGVKEYYSYSDNITKLTIKSTVSIGSGTRTVSFYIIPTTGGSSVNCSVRYTYQNTIITAINSTSGNITATVNNGAVDVTIDSGYYFYYINSINNFALIGYRNYSGGQSARVIEGSVNKALNDVATKIPPLSVTDVSMYHGDNGTLNLERRYSSGSSWTNTSIPLNDEKTLKYDTSKGLYVNFKGQSLHTATLNTSSSNYCIIPSVAASYDYAYDSFTVRVNSGYTGSSTSFTWTISGISEDGGAYANVYVYDKTSNTVTLTSRSFEVDVTQNGYYFTFTANNSYTPSNPIKLTQFRENGCNIAGTGNTYQERYIIDLVQAPTYEYNGQEVIDDIYSKLDTKQTTLTAGTGISIIDNVISATGGGGGGVSESAFTAYTAATDSRIAEDEEVTAAALNALDEKIDNIDGTATVELTQAEYDALVTAGTVSADTYYIITDAQAGDLTNYYTKSETNTLLGGKADTATTYTKTEVDTALSGKQDTLSAGTGIDITNNVISATGGGGGGGKAIEAGRGISVTTGETADTVSVSLPISAGTGNYSIIEGNSTSAMSMADHAEGRNTYANGGSYTAHAEGYQTSATSSYCHSEGRGTKATNEGAHAEGKSTVASGSISHAEGESTKALAPHSHSEGAYTTASSVSNVSGIQIYQGYKSRHAEGCSTFANNGCTHTEGYYTQANNFGEHASGVYNVSNSATTTYGDSGNTLFSVGNGTADNARHNAFEIRQNGDIYITINGQDVKLQDILLQLSGTTS